MNTNTIICELAEAARIASRQLANASAAKRNAALMEAAVAIRNRIGVILSANTEDMRAAQEKGVAGALLDRLRLDESRVQAMAAGLEAIAALPDPVGRVLAEWERPSGLHIRRVSVPLGVIGIIYEARPNVTADAAALCIKSGNACILRGGSESFHSSAAITECLHDGLRQAELPETAVQSVPSTDRALVGDMLGAAGLIDIIVPRGGRSLTERVMNESRVPTILHLDGNCHTYLHAKADPKKAVEVTLNAKMRRTGICGATESLLVDAAATGILLPPLVDALKAAGCELRGDAASRAADARISPATEADWDTEYLDAVLSVKVVQGVEEAIEHINRHGSHHTDAIITEDHAAAQQFLARVDSAIVMHNTSTQFADGGEFGMGAEIGISTGRLHARGPVGCEQLTTYKYMVESDGAIRPK